MRILTPLYAVALCGVLASCGYSPLYYNTNNGSGAGAALSIGSVAMAKVETQPGQRLVAQEVRQRLLQSYPNGVAGGGAVAEITITEETTTLALQRTAQIERAKISLTGLLVVRDASGTEVLNTSLTSTAAYNVETTPFSTESGKAFARQIAARNLAEAIDRRLALWGRTK